MAETSGSLGGDDSSKLDELMKSIQGNSGKLEILNKILGKIQDAGGSTAKSEKSFLKNIETVLDKSIVDKFANKALAKQADLDRLASNTFRATETVVSEVLSRMGGTSFYPVLSAFRVARESVAVATGKPQNELDVLDMFKFVNDASKNLINSIFDTITGKTKEVASSVDQLNKSTSDLKPSSEKTFEVKNLFTSIFDAITGKTKEITPAVDQLNESMSDFKSSSEKIAEILRKDLNVTDFDVSTDELMKQLEEETKPLQTYLSNLLNSIQENKKKIEDLKVQEVKDLFAFLETTPDYVKLDIYKDIFDTLRKELDQLDETVSEKDISQLKEKLQLEKKLFTERKRTLNEEVIANDMVSDSINQIASEARNAAELAAGIAGLSVTTSFLVDSIQTLTKSFGDLARTSIDAIVESVSSAKGIKTATSVLAPIGKSVTGTISSVGQTAGNILGSIPAVTASIGSAIGGSLGTALAAAGPIVGGPLGAVLGKALGDAISLPINTAINLLQSIESGISEITDDIIPFSPALLDAVIEQNLAILNDDIRRGNQIGDEIASITRAQTRLQLASREAFDNLIEVAEPVLVAMLEGLTLGIKLVSNIVSLAEKIPGILTVLEFISNLIQKIPGIDIIADMLRSKDLDPNIDQSLLMRPDLVAPVNPGANIRGMFRP